MKNLPSYLPPIMKTPFWRSLLETAEEVSLELKNAKMDVIKNIYSISESDKETLFEIASVVYGLDKFLIEKLYEFLVFLEKNGTSILTDEEAGAKALERLRAEIAKIPFSMKKRGTFEFYKSLFEFCDFNYKGIITLIWGKSDSRVQVLKNNIAVQSYPEVKSSQFLFPVINEDFSGVVATASRLDDGDNTLDMNRANDFLDQISVTEGTLYQRGIFLGLFLDRMTIRYYTDPKELTVGAGTGDYPGQPSFPYNLGRYYQQFINLNKRASDIIIFGPVLSLAIRPKVEGEVYSGWVEDGRLISRVTSVDSLASFKKYAILYYDKSILEIQSARDKTIPFYEDTIRELYVSDDNQEITLMHFCQGDLCRHQIKAQSSFQDGTTTVTAIIPIEDWGPEMIFRLSPEDSEQDISTDPFTLFYLDPYGSVVQRVSNPLADIKPNWSCTLKKTETEVTMTFVTTDIVSGSQTPYTKLIYMGQRYNTKVKTIMVKGVTESGAQQDFVSLEFIANTAIEICRNVTLTTYLNIQL